ncbi:MAG: hypothetical protein ACYDBB_05365 [Armatimonadota bacterium]
MRTWGIRLIPLLVLLCLFTAAFAVETRPSVLPNGGFEDGMTGWTAAVNDPGKTGSAVTIDGEQHREGTNSFRLFVQPKCGANLSCKSFPVEGGKDYLITLWYRSEGFSRTGNFDGVSASYTVTWYDAAGKPIIGTGQGLPYSAQPKWRRSMRLATAPANAASANFSCGISCGEKSLPSTLWLDKIELRKWPGTVKADGFSKVFHIDEGTFSQRSFRRVADDDSSSGFAVIANTRFATKGDYLSGGMYLTGLKPGQYRAIFRLKLADYPEENTPVVNLDANPQFCGHSDRQVMSKEFLGPGVYQDVPLRFVVAPDTGYVDFRAFWSGKITTWVDTVTIVEEEIYTDEQVKAYFE